MTSANLNQRILIADDQDDVLQALRLLFKSQGFKTDLVNSPKSLIKAIQNNDYDSILMDLNYSRDTTSGKEGLDLIREIQLIDCTLPIIVMTAWGSIELAVTAMKAGARDFVQKPWDNTRLLSIVRTQVELRRALLKGKMLEEENRMLRGENKSIFIADSKAMDPVVDLLSRIGPSDANVLLTGENGTGKNVVANLLHTESKRSQSPLITVNIAGLAETLFESELFGHVKGAFTDARTDRVGRFELANGGTLFLDEIANIPLSLQSKLLRVLETGEFERVGSSKTYRVDVRVISATNANLQKSVEEGSFRRDLFFRLNTIEIRLPPLRDRKEDIPVMARFFLKKHALHYRKNLDDFDPPALQLLCNFSWPGNIRELDHVIERAVLMTKGNTISVADLGLRDEQRMSSRLEDMSLEEVETILIQKALQRFDGNVSKAAGQLGLSRSGLYRRLSKYGL